MSKTLKQVVDALVTFVGNRELVICGSHDVSPDCIYHLAEQIPMRCWPVHWDNSEVPLYMPIPSSELSEDERMEFLEAMVRLTSSWTQSYISGDDYSEYIPGTDDIIWYDTDCSDHRVLVIGLTEEYERFMPEE